MKTVLITGGAGYVGSHCTKDLAGHGYRCVVLDNLVAGHKSAVLSADFIELDLSDTEGLKKVFNQYAFDAVMHFAAHTQVGESVEDPGKYYENNVGNTINLLNIMSQYKVKRLVFSSSCAVYGNPEYLPLDENHPQNPINPYGKSKYIIEKILEDYKKAYGLNFISLRYFNVAGCDPGGQLGDQRHPVTWLIPILMQVLQGKRDNITIFGQDYDTPDGTCIRDYIHVQDIVRAHRLALEKMFRGTASDHINIGTGTGLSVQEVIDATERVTGQKIPIRPGERRPGDPAVLVASNDKAKQILGWEAAITDIEEMIASAWQWASREM